MSDGAPRQPSASPWLALADILPIGLGLWYAWAVAATIAARWSYPFDLEWMEGGMLSHAWQVLHGQPIYPIPGPDHIAYVYPPGYTAVLAALGSVFGLSLPLGRAVSIAATLLATLAIPVGARRQGGHWGPGVVGGLLFVVLYPTTGAFYDLVRPDAVAVALFAWAVVIGLERHRMAPVASGLLLAAAFACKHNLAIFGIPLLAHYALRVSRAHATRFAVASIAPALLFTAWMQVVTGGTFLTYLIGLPSTHGMHAARAFPGVELELVWALFPGLVGAALYLGVRGYRRAGLAALALPFVLALVLGALGPSAPISGGVVIPGRMWVRHAGFAALGFLAGVLVVVPIDGHLGRRADPRWTVGALLAGVAVGIGVLMRAHIGGFVNVLIPVHWTICFGLAVLAGRARNLWPAAGTAVSVVFALGALHWVGDRSNLDRLVPTEADREMGEQVVAAIAENCPNGPILSPYAAWLPVQAGHAPSVHLIAIWDIDHEYGPFREYKDVLAEAVASHYWECVVEGSGRPLGFGVHEHYPRTTGLPVRPRVFVPKTGWRERPASILRPR